MFLFPVVTGTLAAAAFPKGNQAYLAWMAFVPLLSFVLYAKSMRAAVLGGLISGIVEFFLLLKWIPPVLARYGGIPTIGAWSLDLLLVGAMGSYAAFCCGLTWYCIRVGGRHYLFIFPFAWVAAEYLRGHLIFGGFPWLFLGYSQTPYLSVVQIADMTGVFGVSFLIMWMNAALAWSLSERKRNKIVWPILAGAVMILASFLYGETALRRWGRQAPTYRAALLQGNLLFEDPEKELEWKFQQGYFQMADRLRTRVDLLILPESPSPKIFQYDAEYRRTVQQLAGRFRLGIVLNNIAYGPGESRYFNSAYFVASNGAEVARYDKIHLVPFGEYIPWKSFLPFARTISKDVGGFEAGTDYVVVPLGGHFANAIICFEAVFPELVRRFVAQGSELIVNLTNDGWYGDTAAPYQHLSMSRWRAIENRRYLLRAANSGISAIIEPTGAIQASTKLLQPDICEGQFSFLESQTFYTRYGDLFAYLCATIMCLLVIRARAIGFRRRV